MSQYVSLKHRLETIIARCETLLIEHPLWVAEYTNTRALLTHHINILRFEHPKRSYYITNLESLHDWLQRLYEFTETNTYILPMLREYILFIHLSIQEIRAEKVTRSKSCCL